MVQVNYRGRIMNKAIQLKQNQKATVIETSLYELIEAMQEETSPHDDQWIIATVADLMKAGKIYWGAEPKKLES